MKSKLFCFKKFIQLLFNWYLGHLPEKWRHFVFPKMFLCFRVSVKIRAKFRVRVLVYGNTLKFVFGQTSIRASVLDLFQPALPACVESRWPRFFIEPWSAVFRRWFCVGRLVTSVGFVSDKLSVSFSAFIISSMLMLVLLIAMFEFL